MKSLNYIYLNLKLGSNAKVKDQIAKWFYQGFFMI